MRDSSNIAESVRMLEAQYLAGGITLNALAHRAEVLLEQARSALSPEKHQQAMNCAYVIEEINALVLDEGRAMSAGERLRLTIELQKLSSLMPVA